MMNEESKRMEITGLEDSTIAKSLFGDVKWAWLWLILRVYIGWSWFEAGWSKVNDPVWFGGKAGTAITGFVNGALAKTTGEHPDVQSWYASFLRNLVLPYASIWSYMIVLGEIVVGVCLMVGLLTGIAAFFGSFMNVNYLLAGTVSSNPILFVIATWLVLSWKTAGWWGLDRYVLPALAERIRPREIYREPKMPRAHPTPQH